MRTLPGGPSIWSANRTSGPGPGANGIVLFPNGMGCKSPAFRHFACFRSSITQSSRLLPGRLRVRVSPGAPVSRGRQLTSSGSLAFNQAMRVQFPSPLPQNIIVSGPHRLTAQDAVLSTRKSGCNSRCGCQLASVTHHENSTSRRLLDQPLSSFRSR